MKRVFSLVICILLFCSVGSAYATETLCETNDIYLNGYELPLVPMEFKEDNVWWYDNETNLKDYQGLQLDIEYEILLPINLSETPLELVTCTNNATTGYIASEVEGLYHSVIRITLFSGEELNLMVHTDGINYWIRPSETFVVQKGA